MTEVCILGSADADLPGDLLAYETARGALSAYDLRSPYPNAVSVETISLGTAVSLLGDLDWYLARLARDALVRESSVSGEEYLSRALATAVRDGAVDPGDTGRYLKVYGVSDGALTEPMYAARVDDRVPEYDLRDVEDTVRVRVTEAECG